MQLCTSSCNVHGGFVSTGFLAPLSPMPIPPPPLCIQIYTDFPRRRRNSERRRNSVLRYVGQAFAAWLMQPQPQQFRRRYADTASLVANFRTSTVNVLYVAPTILPPLRVRNCETPLPCAVLTFLFLHRMGIETVSLLDLTKHDVVLVHLVGGGDGVVGAHIARADPRPQRAARASVRHRMARQQLRLDQPVPLPSLLHLC